ncbi:MAG: ion channel [bacterium]
MSNEDYNWVQKYGYEKSTDFELYSAAIYFSVTTMATVGYGDISGTNTTEKYVCILMMVFGVMFFSVISGSISAMLDSMD